MPRVQQTRKGYLPGAPFIRLMKQWMERESSAIVGSKHFDESNVGHMGLMGSTERLLELVWPDTTRDNSARRLYSMLRREWKFITFDLADRIVTNLYGPQMWLEDPSLRRLYAEVNLIAADLAYPVNDAVKDAVGQEIASLFQKHGSSNKVAETLGVSVGPVKRFVREYAA